MNPENEGKVFLYKYGKRIFDKVMAKMQPNENDYDPEPAFNPFDLWKGADFKLKIKQVAGFWNYDDSSFTTPATLGNFDDAKLEEIFNASHDLSEFTAPDQFKSYEELQERLNTVLKSAPRIDTDTIDEEIAPATISASAPVTTDWTEDASSESVPQEDEALSYFAKLANED